jgi:hypothetical protein
MSKAWGVAPRRDALRLAITFATLLAFIFQTLIVQTHIHVASPVGAKASPFSIEKSLEPGQKSDKFPPADDPANCPICQELLHAGTFVTPALTALLVSTVVTVVHMVVAEIATTEVVYSHGWKSRAPPSA